MILFFSNSGESCPIAYRMQKDEDVQVYIHSPQYRGVYHNMIPKCSLTDLRKTARRADLVIFDMVKANERTREDLALLKIFDVSAKSASIFGPVAAKISKDTEVIGASEVTEEWELDRKGGADLARAIGLDLPEVVKFERLSDAVKFLQDEGKEIRWVFKPDNNQDLDLTYVEKYPGELVQKLTHEWMERITSDKFPFLLEKYIEGVEISTEGWYNGTSFVHFNHTIEDKRLMNGNLGPATGSQSNVVWFKKGGILISELKKLGPKLNQAGYRGPVDINAIVTKDRIYFLEFTARFGYDALYGLLTLCQDVNKFFTKGFLGSWRPGFVASQRVTIPPYPYANRELLKELAKDVSITPTSKLWMEDVYFDAEGCKCTGADGVIGVMTGYGTTLGEAISKMYQNIDKLRISSFLQYRTDGGRRAEKAMAKLTDWGLDFGRNEKSRDSGQIRN